MMRRNMDQPSLFPGLAVEGEEAGRKAGHSVSPLSRNALKKSKSGEVSPGRSPEGGHDRGEEPTPPPFTFLSGGISGPKACSAQELFETALRKELGQARKALGHWSGITAELDDELAEERRERRDLNERLAETHGGRRLDLSRKAERVPLFKALDRLAVQWGPTRQRRKDAALEAKLLMRDVDRLEKS